MIKEFSFSSRDGQFISEAIQLSNGNACIHLEFANKSKNRCVSLYQSIDGNVFVSFDYNSYVGKAFEKNVSGGIPGQYIQVQCTSEPIVAKILEAD